MSFLLQKSARGSNDQSGGLSRLSLRSHSNGNSNATKASVGGNSSRTFSFNRGGRKISNQQVSGNQIMLQSHRSTTTTDQRQKQRLQSYDNSKQQQQSAKQEQEFLEDYTMEEIMQDLVILEQQQREAQRKLASAQTMKQKRLDQQRQLNTLLEKKSYSNGALRAKLLQAREFLSVATRDLGNRKLVTDRLQYELADFERKLKRGLGSAKMVRTCSAKIDSLFIIVEHKVASITRRKENALKANKELQKKYERLEEKDRMMRLAIQDAYQKARALAQRKRSLRLAIEKLDRYKVAAHNTEQSIELRIRTTREQLKAEADQADSIKVILCRDIENVIEQRTAAASEIQAECVSLQTLIVKAKAKQEEIVECHKAEGSAFNPDDGNLSQMASQLVFREHFITVEEEKMRDEEKLDGMNKLIEEMGRAIEESKAKTAHNDKETSALISSTEAMAEQDEIRRQKMVEFQTSLESTRTEVTKLEESFQEMKAIRMAESRAHVKAISDVDVRIEKQTTLVETLRLKMKLEDTSHKTKIRLFEDTEKPVFVAKLEQAENESQSAEKQYHGLVEISHNSFIEPKVQAELKEKFSDETMKWGTHNREMSSSCIEYTKKFPELLKIDYTYNEEGDRDKQIKLALADLQNDCKARKSASEAKRNQKTQQKIERQMQVEAMKNKLKRKEEAQATRKRRQLQEESNWRATNSNPEAEEIDSQREPKNNDHVPAPIHAGNTATRRGLRQRKGSDFFDPKEHGNIKLDTAITPNQPRQLVSAFLSQSSGQRVRWKNDDDDKNCVEVDLEQDCSTYVTVPDSFATTSETDTEPNDSAVNYEPSKKTRRIINTEKREPSRPKHQNDHVQLEKELQSVSKSRPGGKSRRRSAKSISTDKSKCDENQSDSISKDTRFPFDDISYQHDITGNDGVGTELHREHRKRVSSHASDGSSSRNTLSKSRKRSSITRGAKNEDRNFSSKKRMKPDQSRQQSSSDTFSSDTKISIETHDRDRKIAPSSKVEDSSKGDATKCQDKSPRNTRSSVFVNASTSFKDVNATSTTQKDSEKRTSRTRTSVSVRGINKEAQDTNRVSSTSSGRARKKSRQKTTEKLTALERITIKECNEKHPKETRSMERSTGSSAESTSFAANSRKESRSKSCDEPISSAKGRRKKSREKPRVISSLSARSVRSESYNTTTSKANERPNSSTVGNRRESKEKLASPVRGYDSRTKGNEKSNRVHATRKEPREIASKKPDKSIRKNSVRSVAEASRDKSRVKSNASALNKEGREKDRKAENKSVRGDSTRTQGTTKGKVSSSSSENGVLKKRKMRGDDVSTSTSNTGVIGRRRKKHSGHRSKISSARDVSCDIDFH